MRLMTNVSFVANIRPMHVPVMSAGARWASASMAARPKSVSSISWMNMRL